MPSWFRARKKPEETLAQEALIRVCVVSRDPTLTEEAHKDLLVGFLTRGGYEFESDHPDFQQYCDVLLVDLRAAGLQADPREGLAFIDSVRKSVSHPPIVALCDADAGEFSREVMQSGAYDKLPAPLNMPELRLALQRAYEFRSAETKLESFLSQQSAARDRLRGARPRKVARPAVVAPRPVRRARRRPGPSRLAVGFVLGCVLFFAGLVAVRTLLVGMGDALASAGFAADPGAAAPLANSDGMDAHSSNFAAHRLRPLAATADFTPRAFDTELDSPAAPHSSLPGYEPAAILERVAPRYSGTALARRLEGTVRIRAIVGPDGAPRGLARVSGDPALAQIAMDAIALWRYNPATVDGEPVESEVIIPVDFRLPN